MSEKTEADEIDKLIAKYRLDVGDWAVSLSDKCLENMERKEQELIDRIRSLISERDALRSAMKSHR